MTKQKLLSIDPSRVFIRDIMGSDEELTEDYYSSVRYVVENFLKDDPDMNILLRVYGFCDYTAKTMQEIADELQESKNAVVTRFDRAKRVVRNNYTITHILGFGIMQYDAYVKDKESLISDLNSDYSFKKLVALLEHIGLWEIPMSTKVRNSLATGKSISVTPSDNVLKFMFITEDDLQCCHGIGKNGALEVMEIQTSILKKYGYDNGTKIFRHFYERKYGGIYNG